MGGERIVFEKRDVQCLESCIHDSMLPFCVNVEGQYYEWGVNALNFQIIECNSMLPLVLIYLAKVKSLHSDLNSLDLYTQDIQKEQEELPGRYKQISPVQQVIVKNQYPTGTLSSSFDLHIACSRRRRLIDFSWILRVM